MDVMEFMQMKDSTYFVQENCDYMTLSSSEGLMPPHECNVVPLCKSSVLSYNIMSRSAFHLGNVADLLIRWNTDYLTSLMRQGGNAAQIEGDLKLSVDSIQTLIRSASEVILSKPVCCPICRFRVKNEEAMLNHYCSPLKFGCHLCACNEVFETHIDYKIHALPNPTWLRKIDSAERSFGVINWNGMCGSAFVHLLLTTAECQEQRYSFRCVCAKKDTNKFSNFIHYVAHLSVCEEFEATAVRTCGFCYWPFLTAPVVDSYHSFLEQRIDTAAPLSSSFNWADFHKFFVIFKDTHRFQPLRLFTENGIFQSIIESEFDAKDFLFGESNEECCRRNILKFIEDNLKNYTTYVSDFPNVCSSCFCRLQVGFNSCANSDNCPREIMHRCKCGKVFGNHADYWIHMVIECRFQICIHLVLFALKQKQLTITCACQKNFQVSDLYAFLCHWERCPEMIEEMMSNCYFCEVAKSENDEESTKSFIQQMLGTKLSDSLMPDFFVLGMSGYALDSIIASSTNQSISPSSSSGTSLSMMPPDYLHYMKLFNGPVLTTYSDETEEMMDHQ